MGLGNHRVLLHPLWESSVNIIKSPSTLLRAVCPNRPTLDFLSSLSVLFVYGMDFDLRPGLLWSLWRIVLEREQGSSPGSAPSLSPTVSRPILCWKCDMSLQPFSRPFDSPKFKIYFDWTVSGLAPTTGLALFTRDLFLRSSSDLWSGSRRDSRHTGTRPVKRRIHGPRSKDLFP